jgi:hypothetical protein
METLVIDAGNRWDALTLAQRLTRYHSYLVQLDAQHWQVRLRSDGDSRRLPRELRERVESWLVERDLPCTILHGDRHQFSLTRPTTDS